MLMTQKLAACGLGAALLFVMPPTAGAEEDVEITKPCPEQIGLSALYAPFAKHARTFYDGRVNVFNTDVVEPVARSKGLAFIIFDEEGGDTCIYVGPFSSVSAIADAKVKYDDSKGLLLEVKTGEYLADGPGVPKTPLKPRINAKAQTVTSE